MTLLQDRYGAKDYTKVLSLKLDHSARPIWIVSEKYVMFCFRFALCILFRERVIMVASSNGGSSHWFSKHTTSSLGSSGCML